MGILKPPCYFSSTTITASMHALKARKHSGHQHPDARAAVVQPALARQNVAVSRSTVTPPTFLYRNRRV